MSKLPKHPVVNRHTWQAEEDERIFHEDLFTPLVGWGVVVLFLISLWRY